MRERGGDAPPWPPGNPSRAWPNWAALLRHATSASTRLTVEGTERPLPASLELTGYRVVEHLLTALLDEPSAQVDVSAAVRSRLP